MQLKKWAPDTFTARSYRLLHSLLAALKSYTLPAAKTKTQRIKGLVSRHWMRDLSHLKTSQLPIQTSHNPAGRVLEMLI